MRAGSAHGRTLDPPGDRQQEENTAREQRLAEVFVELADTLVEEFDVVDFLQTLTERAVELVDADSAGLMLDNQRGQLTVAAYTDEPTRILELLELQNDEGPCLECFSTGARLSNVDLGSVRDRWPRFAPAAAGAGFAVVHAVPMRLRRQVIGALNLFARSPAPLPDEQLAVVQGLADVATIGLLHERAVRDQVVLAEQLQAALHSRVLVEQAKGVLSARATVDVATAFQLMRRYARGSGRSLTTVAAEVVAGSLGADQLQQGAAGR